MHEIKPRNLKLPQARLAPPDEHQRLNQDANVLAVSETPRQRSMQRLTCVSSNSCVTSMCQSPVPKPGSTVTTSPSFTWQTNGGATVKNKICQTIPNKSREQMRHLFLGSQVQRGRTRVFVRIKECVELSTEFALWQPLSLVRCQFNPPAGPSRPALADETGQGMHAGNV